MKSATPQSDGCPCTSLTDLLSPAANHLLTTSLCVHDVALLHARFALGMLATQAPTHHVGSASRLHASIQLLYIGQHRTTPLGHSAAGLTPNCLDHCPVAARLQLMLKRPVAPYYPQQATPAHRAAPASCAGSSCSLLCASSRVRLRGGGVG